MDGFYQWVRNIAACLIFMSLILSLLPDGKNVKYIRHFMGMVLILVVLAPAGKLLRLEESFSELAVSLERDREREEFKDELKLMGEEYTDSVVKSYEEELAVQAGRFLSEAGFSYESVRVEIDGEEGSASLGQIRAVEVNLSSGEETGEEDSGQIVIEKKRVQILDEEPERGSYREEAEDGEFRRLLSEELSVPADSVHIFR